MTYSLKEASTTFGSATNTSGNLIIKSGTTTALTFSGANVTAAGTVAATGAVTANAGVNVDNINIDGTEIDLSSGDLTVDVAGDISLDAGGADVIIKDDGTAIGTFTNSSSDFVVTANVQDKDIIFKGDDGGSAITALTMDMSEAGAASFNGAVTANAGVVVDNINIDGTEIDLSSGNLTVDVAGDISLDANDADIFFKDDGTTFGSATNTSGNLIIKSGATTALTLSGANVTAAGTVAATGAVTANAGVNVDNINIDGTEIDLSSGDLTVDVEGDIVLDANGGEITLSDNNSATGKVIVDMDNTNIKHQYDASNYVTTTLASTGSVTKETVGAGTTDSDYTLNVDGELVLDAADAAGVIMKFNGTSQASVIDGVIKPTSNNDIDLGTSGNQFKNVYIAGNIDLEGNIDVNGTTDLDNTDIAGTFRMDGTTFDLDASGAVTIESSGAAISIGADDIDQAINIGTQGERTLSIGNGAFAQTIGIGNATGATAVTIAAGTGDLALTSTDNITLVATDIVSMSDGTATFSLAGSGATALAAATTVDLDATGAMTMNSSAGTISIADDNVDQNVNLATGGTRTLAIGINDGTDVTTITSRGNLAVDGATISLDATTSFNIDNTNASNGVTINTATSGGTISIGHSTSETTVNDNLNVTGSLLYNSKIVSTKSNGTTLAASESGSVILQSTNSATITLPATVAGLRYTFVWAGTAGQTFNISPNSSDKIMGSILDVADGNIVTAASSGAGTDNKDLQLDGGSQVGDRVTLVADGDSGWYIEEALGSWAFES